MSHRLSITLPESGFRDFEHWESGSKATAYSLRKLTCTLKNSHIMNLQNAFLTYNLTNRKSCMLMIGLQVVLILLKVLLQLLKHLEQKRGVVEHFLFASCAKSVLSEFRLFAKLKCDLKKLFKFYYKTLEVFKEQLLFFFFLIFKHDFQNDCICTWPHRHVYHV